MPRPALHVRLVRPEPDEPDAAVARRQGAHLGDDVLDRAVVAAAAAAADPPGAGVRGGPEVGRPLEVLDDEEHPRAAALHEAPELGEPPLRLLPRHVAERRHAEADHLRATQRVVLLRLPSPDPVHGGARRGLRGGRALGDDDDPPPAAAAAPAASRCRGKAVEHRGDVLLGLGFWFGGALVAVVVLHACSTLALTWVLEKPASRMTRLTLGSSRMETTSCSSSIFTASTGCCWVSTDPRRWCACARLNAATSALESDGG
ncbi:Os04g0416450 [Oryza sativa Japonica Group]|uniref:Os04g0416450 protein n=1 Tax=Oryza sativa subsp. japonica TaxID=39947 RepID=A0A0P0WAE7_ORYSJ|nr:Os04g0416450 [Oryza sativa Japonica Group]